MPKRIRNTIAHEVALTSAHDPLADAIAGAASGGQRGVGSWQVCDAGLVQGCAQFSILFQSPRQVNTGTVAFVGRGEAVRIDGAASC